MSTQPSYALSSRTPRWALDPYRFPGLADLDTAEAESATEAPIAAFGSAGAAGERVGRTVVPLGR
ncbi:hypothetical protein ACFWBI_10315 [Streptomyces sp. NPDC059982]|uniref:hypothetical protein n=1 Tax=unclassified Streptomyces TaxID=2593676 RepID=UPI0036C03D55